MYPGFNLKIIEHCNGRPFKTYYIEMHTVYHTSIQFINKPYLILREKKFLALGSWYQYKTLISPVLGSRSRIFWSEPEP
jgi:hypothetical protein